MSLVKGVYPSAMVEKHQTQLRQITGRVCSVVNIRGLLAVVDTLWLRCNRWLLPPNEQLSCEATLSAHLLLLSLFIHACVHAVSHVSHILHIVILTPFYLEIAFNTDCMEVILNMLTIKISYL